MKVKIKSIRQGNWIGLALVYPDGTMDMVALVAMPPDRDWRANVAFYDDLVTLYKKRIRDWFSV